LMQTSGGHRKQSDGGFSDTSSGGSFLDETDREVSSLTDRAFRSLCIGDEAIYNDSDLSLSSPKQEEKEREDRKRVAQKNFNLRMQQYGHEWITGGIYGAEIHKDPQWEAHGDRTLGMVSATFQHALVETSQLDKSLRAEKLSFHSNGATELHSQQSRSHSRVSSLIRAFDTDRHRDGPGTDDMIREQNDEPSWDKSALMSIQRELSEFSCQQNFKSHHFHPAGSFSCRDANFCPSEAEKMAQISHSYMKSSQIKHSMSSQVNCSSNFFIHSEFSPFKLWRDYNRFPFQGAEASGFMHYSGFPKWYQTPMYNELSLEKQAGSHCREIRHPRSHLEYPRSISTSSQKWAQSLGTNKLPTHRPSTASPSTDMSRRVRDTISSVKALQQKVKMISEHEMSNQHGVFNSTESWIYSGNNALPVGTNVVSDNTVSSFRTGQLLTPSVQKHQDTEISHLQQYEVSPQPVEHAPVRAESRGATPEVRMSSYRSRASSLLFNLKDNRKRVKSTYSPNKFKGFDTLEKNQQPSIQEPHEIAFTDSNIQCLQQEIPRRTNASVNKYHIPGLSLTSQTSHTASVNTELLVQAAERHQMSANEEQQQRKATHEEQRRVTEEQQRMSEQEEQHRKITEEENIRQTADEQQGRAAEEQQMKTEREEQQRKLAEIKQRKREAQEQELKDVQFEEQRSIAEEQRKVERRRAAEEQQRRAAQEEQQRSIAENERERRAEWEQQKRAAQLEQQRGIAAEEQKRQAAHEEQRRAAQEQQRRAAQLKEQRRIAEEEQRRKAAYEEQKRAAWEQQRRAAHLEEQRRIAEEEQQRKAAYEEEKRAAWEQQRGAAQLEEQMIAEEEQRRKAAHEEKKRAAQEQQRGAEILRQNRGTPINRFAAINDSATALLSSSQDNSNSLHHLRPYSRRSMAMDDDESRSVISNMSEDVESFATSAADLTDMQGLFDFDRPESACSFSSDISRSMGKPPAVPPKSEKALRRAQRLTSRRIKKELSKVAAETPLRVGKDDSRFPSSSQSSNESANYPQSYPLTQRKVLQDPGSGQYFVVDVPVQVKTKTFFDPETGKYVQLKVRQTGLNISQPQLQQTYQQPQIQPQIHIRQQKQPLSINSKPFSLYQDNNGTSQNYQTAVVNSVLPSNTSVLATQQVLRQNHSYGNPEVDQNSAGHRYSPEKTPYMDTVNDVTKTYNLANSTEDTCNPSIQCDSQLDKSSVCENDHSANSEYQSRHIIAISELEDFMEVSDW
uniref:Uncharacterized LOC107086609 n=1 Tax=Cyprinodon variegatus TaxID=28743 RepID=A0A3Q2DP66_CYPVA